MFTARRGPQELGPGCHLAAWHVEQIRLLLGHLFDPDEGTISRLEGNIDDTS
jgi:hypothetical protein